MEIIYSILVCYLFISIFTFGWMYTEWQVREWTPTKYYLNGEGITFLGIILKLIIMFLIILNLKKLFIKD